MLSRLMAIWVCLVWSGRQRKVGCGISDEFLGLDSEEEEEQGSGESGVQIEEQEVKYCGLHAIQLVRSLSFYYSLVSTRFVGFLFLD